MAEEGKPTAAEQRAAAVEQAERDERAFARRAAKAELDAQGIEDERRARLAENELGNYERSLGEPMTEGK